jgi:hypothetical protein
MKNIFVIKTNVLHSCIEGLRMRTSLAYWAATSQVSLNCSGQYMSCDVAIPIQGSYQISKRYSQNYKREQAGWPNP